MRTVLYPLIPFLYSIVILLLGILTGVWTWLFVSLTICGIYFVYRKRDIETNHALTTSEHTDSLQQERAVQKWIREVKTRRESEQS